MSTQRLRKEWKEPVVLILAALFLFTIGGTAIAGCTGTAEPVRKIKIAIDSAYGGDNDGFNGLIKESSFNEAAADALEQRLSYDERFEVMRTHPSGTPLAAKDAAEKINAFEPDIALSIHAGFDPDPDVKGMNVYADIPSSKDNAQSLEFARQLQKTFASVTDDVNVQYLYFEPYGETAYRLIRQDVTEPEETELETWDLLEQTEAPAVITELIHVTNQEEIDRWANEEGYAEAAELYYDAFCEFYGFEPLPVPEPEGEEE